MKRSSLPLHPTIAVPLMAVMGLTLVLFSSDLYIPSMPQMAKDLYSQSDVVQLTLSAQFFGIAIFGLLAGPLSDYLGRRYIILTSSLGFVFCAAGCALAQNVETLIFFRLLQGCSASALTVLSIALIKDIFPTLRSTQILSRVMMASIVSPAIAPILGGYIAFGFGWRTVFYTILIMAIVALAFNFYLLPETNAKVRRKRKENRKIWDFSVSKMIRNYKIVLSNRTFVRYGIIHASLFSGKWCFMTVAPFVFIDILRVPAHVFGYYLAGLGIAFIFFHYLIKPLIKRHGNDRVIQLGLFIGLTGALLFLIAAKFTAFSPRILSITVSLYFGSIALISPAAANLALENFRKMRGTASSAITSLRTFMGFLGSLVGGIIIDEGFISVALFLVFTTIVPLALTFHQEAPESV